MSNLRAQNGTASLQATPESGATLPETSLQTTAAEAMVSIKGVMKDRDSGERMENVRIFFSRKEQYTMVGIIANSKGEFSRKIAPGVYDIEVQYTGKAALKLENYHLDAGGQYFISIEMGSKESTANIEKKK